MVKLKIKDERLPFIALLLMLFSVLGCGVGGPVATSTPAPTPTPEAIDLGSDIRCLGNPPEQKVKIQGAIWVADTVFSVSLEGGRYWEFALIRGAVDLAGSVAVGDGDDAIIYIAEGTDPNHVAPIPEDFTDIEINTDDGEKIGDGAHVVIEGVVVRKPVEGMGGLFNDNCGIRVTRIFSR